MTSVLVHQISCWKQYMCILHQPLQVIKLFLMLGRDLFLRGVCQVAQAKSVVELLLVMVAMLMTPVMIWKRIGVV